MQLSNSLVVSELGGRLGSISGWRLRGADGRRRSISAPRPFDVPPLVSQQLNSALATALVDSVADPKAFRSGRNFSAWIGLVKPITAGAPPGGRRGLARPPLELARPVLWVTPICGPILRTERRGLVPELNGPRSQRHQELLPLSGARGTRYQPAHHGSARPKGSAVGAKGPQ